MADYVAGRGTTALGTVGTVLGSIGTLGALGGNLGGLFNLGGNNNCHENTPINRYEASQQSRIAELETEVKLRDANTFTMGEMGKLRDYFDLKISSLERELCDQKVYNATNTATISCISGQVAQLMSLTKVVIPNTSVCPGWGNVTVAPATTTA
jgi:hypothetical protein